MSTATMPVSPVPDPPTPERSARSPRAGSDFAPLAREIADRGLLRPRPDYYYGAGLVVAGLGWLLVVLGSTWHGSWWALALAPLAAVISAQLSFLGHDLGHHQLTTDRRLRWWGGMVIANLLTGLSFGWWNARHLRHHHSPNVDGEDPDVADGILVWSARQAARRDGIGRWFARHQAWLFWPLLTLTGWALRIDGIRSLRDRPRGERWIEGLLLAAHAIGVVSALVWLNGWLFAAVFVLVLNLVYGLIMGTSFAPNHVGMEMSEVADRDHLRKQVLSSRNIAGGPLIDWWFGGLNRQIEHHLFPSMPRPNLPRAARIVRRHVHDRGLPYHEVGLITAHREIWRHLRDVGRSGGS